jgi:hypothetical protein
LRGRIALQLSRESCRLSVAGYGMRSPDIPRF